MGNYQDLQTAKWYKKNVEMAQPDQEGMILSNGKKMHKGKLLEQLDRKIKELKKDTD